VYYKIEDKWFNLLDWLEAHHIPIYKIVDPLEKRGIPSLPVFIALLLILIYVIFASLSFGGGAGFTLCVKDSSNNTVSGAPIRIVQGGQEFFSGTTDSNGCYVAALEAGSYSARANKSGCDSNPHSFIVEDASGSTTITLQCGASMSQKTFCITPQDAGSVEVREKNSAGTLNNIYTCDSITACPLSIIVGMSYVFKTDTYSSKEYTYAELSSLGASECVALTGSSQNVPTGYFTVIVKDNKSAPIEEAEVRLVDTTNSQTEITTSVSTDDLGSAVFKGELDTRFRILVYPPSGSSLKTYLSATSYKFEKTPKTVTVYLGNTSAPISVKVVDSSNSPIQGVLATFFDADLRTAKYTDSNGDVTFGAGVGSSYRLGLYKAQKAYREETVYGGQSYTFALSDIGEARTGKIAVTVMRADNNAFMRGVTVTLYNNSGSEPRPIGRDPLTTSDTGQVSWNWLLPGSYCVIASKQNVQSNACSNASATVTAGQTSQITIKLNAAEYKLIVKVMRVDGQPAFRANVTLLDVSRVPMDRKQTNDEGVALFNLTEGKRGVVEVFYVDPDDNSKTFKTEMRVGPLTTDTELPIQLAILDTTLRSAGIFDRSGTDVTNSLLESGSIYNFRFNLGIPEPSAGRLWDKIEAGFAIENPNYAKFNDYLYQSIDSDGKLKTTITPNDVDGVLDPSKNVKITGDYSPSGTTVTWDLPVVIQSDFSGTRESTRMAYDANWTWGSLLKKDPASLRNYVPFEVTKTPFSESGGLLISLYIENVTGEMYGGKPLTDGTVPFWAQIYSQFTLIANITNVDAGNYFGNITFDQQKFQLAFNGVNSGGYAKEFNETKVRVEIPLATPLVQGKTLSIRMGARAVHSNLATVDVYVDPKKEPVDAFGLQIYGIVNADVKTTPSTINEFTTYMTLDAKDRLTNEIVPKAEITFINMSGTSLQHECYYSSGEDLSLPDPTSAYNVIEHIGGTKGTFKIDFVHKCPLIGAGTLGVSVYTKSPDYRITPLNIEVHSCYDVTTREPNAVMGQNTDISLHFDISRCSDANIQYERTWAEKDCQACDFTDSAGNRLADPDHIATRSTASSFDIPFYFKYTGAVSVGVNVQANATFTAYSVSKDPELGNADRITKNKTVKINILVTPTAATFGQYFRPLPIQRYNAPLDCEYNYCTIEQMLMQIQDIANCSPDYNTFQPRTFRFKTVDQNPLQLLAIAKDVYSGITKNVIDTNPDYLSAQWVLIHDAGKLAVGDNQVLMQKYGTASDKCATNFTFSHVGDPAVNPKIAKIQLYMPVNSKSITGADSVMKTSYSSTESDALNNTLVTQWGLGAYKATVGDTAPYDHHLYATVDSGLTDVTAKIEIDQNNRIHFTAKSTALLKALIKSLTAYVNPDDNLLVGSEGELLSLQGENTIVFGPSSFAVNFSGGKVLLDYPTISASISNLIYKQFSIDQNTVQVEIGNGALEQSFMVLAIGGPSALDSRYIDRFNMHWTRGANSFTVPDMGLAWADETGNYVFGRDISVADSLLTAWGASGNVIGNYEMVSSSLVVQYQSKTIATLADLVIKEMTSKQNYSTIIKTTSSTVPGEDCKLSLKEIPGLSIEFDGITDWTKTFDIGGIYLMTIRTDESGTKLYVKTLKSGDTAEGVCQAVVDPADVVSASYYQASPDPMTGGALCGYVFRGSCQGIIFCESSNADKTKGYCNLGDYCRVSLIEPYCHETAVGCGIGGIQRCCYTENPQNCYNCAGGSVFGDGLCCPVGTVFIALDKVCCPASHPTYIKEFDKCVGSVVKSA
jgi:hypothetical protein